MTAQTAVRERNHVKSDLRSHLPAEQAVEVAEAQSFMRGLAIAVALSVPVWALTVFAILS